MAALGHNHLPGGGSCGKALLRDRAKSTQNVYSCFCLVIKLVVYNAEQAFPTILMSPLLSKVNHVEPSLSLAKEPSWRTRTKPQHSERQEVPWAHCTKGLMCR